MNRNGILHVQRTLYALNALIWFLFGCITLFTGKRGDASAVTMLITGVMMFGNAGVLLYLGWRILYQKIPDLIIAAAVLGLNILLTFTDQMGFFDWATLVLDLVLAVLLGVTIVQAFRDRR